MARRPTARRLFLVSTLSAVALGTVAPWDLSTLARQAPPLVRGNAPGEWRYWGADAWSTRYSALDQINASNFGQLQVAWRWNAVRRW